MKAIICLAVVTLLGLGGLATTLGSQDACCGEGAAMHSSSYWSSTPSYSARYSSARYNGYSGSTWRTSARPYSYSYISNQGYETRYERPTSYSYTAYSYDGSYYTPVGSSYISSTTPLVDTDCDGDYDDDDLDYDG